MKNIFLSFILIFYISCSSNVDILPEIEDNIVKPKGLYTSSFGNELALDHPQAKGTLLRVKWKDLEPAKDVYDFSSIEEKLTTIKSHEKEWSLGIIGGGDSPEWLISDIGVGFFEITDMDNNVRKIPKIWDPKVNERLSKLAQELGVSYNNDDDLTLIYIPQMTANGIEGHFNGVSSTELTNAGLTADGWVSSVKETAKIFANAFSNKAIAVEVHDIMNDTSIPSQIMTDLWNDKSLNQRVGAAIWWISGKTTYQPNLLEALTAFQGDIYAQAIGRSDQTYRFENEDYTSIFTQSKTIGVRYIELWEYEFVNDTFPIEFESFNNYTSLTYK